MMTDGWLTPNEILKLEGRDPVAEFRSRFGWIGGKEIRGATLGVSEIPLEDGHCERSGNPDKDGDWMVRGNAAVFDRLSLDLGGFREKIDSAAFDGVLSSDPHVNLLWDHDTRLLLGSTRATDPESLELSVVPTGLRFFSRVPSDLSYAQDLQVLMRRGMVKGASFAFTVGPGGDTWEIDEEENVTRTIKRIDALYDVTITAMGAYPQASSKIVSRSLLQEAIAQGRLPEITLARAIELAAPEEADEQGIAPEGAPDPSLSDEGGVADENTLADLKQRSREAKRIAREDYLRLLKEIDK